MAMDDSTERNIKRKRCDFDNSGYESKLSRLDSVADSTDPDVPKLIREHLLTMLDEADDSDPAIQGLDSFIRSFEEEILTPAPASEVLSSPDLGYLLEASDDELGLPPSFSSEQKMEPFTGLAEIIGFDEQIPGYESFGFGFCGGNPENNQNSNDFIAVGTLFDHTEPLDVTESGWRSESLSAV